MLFALFGTFFLVGISFAIKEWRYSSQDIEYGKTFIWTGIISDISGQGKYIFSDGNNDFLLRSEKEYAIGDQLRLVGNMQQNLKSDGFSYRTISSWMFAVPIFSWGFDYRKWLKMKWRQGTIYEKNSILLDGIDRIYSNPSNPSNPSSRLWIIQSMKKSIQEKIVAEILNIFGECGHFL